MYVASLPFGIIERPRSRYKMKIQYLNGHARPNEMKTSTGNWSKALGCGDKPYLFACASCLFYFLRCHSRHSRQAGKEGERCHAKKTPRICITALNCQGGLVTNGDGGIANARDSGCTVADVFLQTFPRVFVQRSERYRKTECCFKCRNLVPRASKSSHRACTLSELEKDDTVIQNVPLWDKYQSGFTINNGTC